MTYGPPPNQNWQQPPPSGPGYGHQPGYGHGHHPGYGPPFVPGPPRKPAPRWLVIVVGVLVTLFGLAMLTGPVRPEALTLMALILASGVLILCRFRLGAILGAIGFFLFIGLVALGAFTPASFYNPLNVPKLTGGVSIDDDIGAYIFALVGLVLMILCLLAPVLRALRPMKKAPSLQPPGPGGGYGSHPGWSPRR